MDIEQVFPHVLERVDTRPLGPRGVAMLELLYLRQGGRPNPVILGRQEIARLTGRSLDQAKYDTKALERLRGLGMVRRCPGRGRMARAWSLNEPRYWRVRWLGRRDQILAYFAGLNQGDLISLWGDHAGQRPRLWGDDPRDLNDLRGGLSVADRPTTELDRPTTKLAERQSADRSPHNVSESDDDTLCLLVSPPSEKKPSSSSTQEEEQLRSATSGLAAAVAETIGKPGLVRTPLRMIDELVRRYPDRIPELHSLVPTLKGFFGPVEAVTALCQRADALAAAGWARTAPAGPDPEALALNLKRRIATLEEFNPGDETLPTLRAELDALVERLADAS